MMREIFYLSGILLAIVVFSVFWEGISAGGVSWVYDGQRHILQLAGI